MVQFRTFKRIVSPTEVSMQKHMFRSPSCCRLYQSEDGFYQKLRHWHNRQWPKPIRHWSTINTIQLHTHYYREKNMTGKLGEGAMITNPYPNLDHRITNPLSPSPTQSPTPFPLPQLEHQPLSQPDQITNPFPNPITNPFPNPFPTLQDPLRLAYCITYNKSQGQTLQKVLLDITTPPFSHHRRLYVALSRITKYSKIKLYGESKFSKSTLSWFSCCLEYWLSWCIELIISLIIHNQLGSRNVFILRQYSPHT